MSFSFNYNFDINENSFYPNYRNQDFKCMFSFDQDDQESKNDLMSIVDFKSTEEVSSKIDSVSVIAESNHPLCQEEASSGLEQEIDSLVNNLQSQINNGSIENVVDEVLDYQFGLEFDPSCQIKHKRKKTDSQNKELEEALEASRDWDKKFMQGMAKKLDLKYRQVYKWYWDRIKKDSKKSEKKNKPAKASKFEDIESAFSSVLN